ncbi:hypothetical protein DFH08DRAFT_801640 [Mycena albidolilacea]|uniref:Uncharacterized protein n=1 Tax=Mycena albidolilacea TaxID=1033008 RepID=A0AAD7F0K2_9AGAR|nr:hypothetical protein DFH08DRAFT_801640 [Mycena albidolilacea]
MTLVTAFRASDRHSLLSCTAMSRDHDDDELDADHEILYSHKTKPRFALLNEWVRRHANIIQRNNGNTVLKETQQATRWSWTQPRDSNQLFGGIEEDPEVVLRYIIASIDAVISVSEKDGRPEDGKAGESDMAGSDTTKKTFIAKTPKGVRQRSKAERTAV